MAAKARLGAPLDFQRQCTLQAASALIFGVVLLVAPMPLLSMLDINPHDQLELVARMLGGMLFALGATLMSVRHTQDRVTRIRLAAGNATCDLSVAVFVAVAAYRGVIGPLGWLLVGTFTLNALTWALSVIGRTDMRGEPSAP